MHIGKLQRTGESLAVVLPAAFLREAGWQKGDYIAVEFSGKEFTLRRVKELGVRFTATDQRARYSGHGTGVDE